MGYDSAKDTREHIEKVALRIDAFVAELLSRSILHDYSKLYSPEKEVFDEVTPLLRDLTYGSKEYEECLQRMRVALEHHYEANRHHPEQFENGVSGMNLIDLIEMVSDWKSATERHADGDIYKSLEINRKRFGIDDQLYGILKNTIDWMEEEEDEE